MRQEFAMTTVDDRAELEQVEGGIMCPLNTFAYPGCSPRPCPPLYTLDQLRLPIAWCRPFPVGIPPVPRA